MRQIVLDTETTGLLPRAGDRVVELACLEVQDRRLTGRRLHLYFNPERAMPVEALQIHGLSDEFLSDKPLFGAHAEEFLTFVEGAQLLIHNADFDVSFLNSELERVGKNALAHYVAEVVDTLALAKARFPGKRNSLNALCERFGVDLSARTFHGALLDTQLLFEVYLQLTRGQEELLAFDGGPSHSSHAGHNGYTTSQGRQAASLSPELMKLAQDVPVITATEVEQAEHEKVLAGVNKASGGRCIWLSKG